MSVEGTRPPLPVITQCIVAIAAMDALVATPAGCESLICPPGRCCINRCRDEGVDGEVVYESAVNNMRLREMTTLYVNFEQVMEFSEDLADMIERHYYRCPPPSTP